MPATVCACATASGGVAALLRLSGPAATAIARATAAIALGAAVAPTRAQEWPLGLGRLPPPCAVPPRAGAPTPVRT